MKIRTRAFLLGLLPALLVALLLTGYHLHSRLNDLEAAVAQQGAAMARYLASSAEYGVLSGNTTALGTLLDQAMKEPGVASVAVVWPDQVRLARGEAIGRLPRLRQASQWREDGRAWFAYPVRLTPLDEIDSVYEVSATDTPPLAWVAVSIDTQQKQAIAQKLLLASLGITLMGMALAILMIRQLVMTGLRPIMDIIATVKHISLGDFGKRTEIPARSPELRELQSSVNQMSESLRSYQQDMEAKILIATAELQHKKKEAELANLAKSRFLATASHDLRQPMHAISLYVESLKPHMQGRAAEDTLNKIERSIFSAVELFNSVLEVTKLDAGVVQPQLAPVRIRKLLLCLADEFAAETDRKGLSLRVRAPDVRIESDALLLERIFRNLLSNALRHTTRGGVLLSARPFQGRLRLQVWDTGSGIAPEHQPRIFEEFFQAEAQDMHTRHGLGLGLAIVRRLARLLHYPLQLHSRPGRGTVFSLDVPVLTETTEDADDPGEASSRPLKGCVLVVDDDPAIRDALGHLLRQWGMEVHLRHNLDQVVHETEAIPDIVLADYQLQNGETGLMVAREVHKRWGAHVPIVVITGDTCTGTIQALRQSDFPVLHKPVRAHQLRALLVALLQGEFVHPGSG